MAESESTSDKRKFHPLIPIALLILVAILVVVGTLIYRGGQFGGLEPFPASSYREQPTNLMGNRYLLDAQIDSQLQWEREIGRLIAVRPNDASDQRIPVFVGNAIDENLMVGQRYRMNVVIGEHGLIYVEALRKY